MEARKISSTNYPIVFQLVSSSDHITPVTGATPTATISKNGGNFNSISGTITEVANGYYKIAGNASDRNTLGSSIYMISAVGADNKYFTIDITNYDPFNTVGDVWDEVLTGVTHNIANSSGKRLRQIASNVVYSGTVVSTTENTVVLDSGADSSDGAYDPAVIVIVTGTGAGQSRLVLQYTGSTRRCVVDRDWKIQPTTGDEYMILADAGREHVNEGLAQGGTINTITLNANASSYDNTYIGQVIFIRSGLGEDQACRVIAYNGTTKVATMAKNWNVIPDTTSAYVMLPSSILDIELFISKIWQYATRTLTSGGGASASDVWGYATRELTSIINLGGDVWEYSPRTLTEYAITGTDTITIDNSITLSAYATNVVTVENIANDTEIWFTVKQAKSQTDAESILQVSKTNGLLFINGSAPVSPITHDDASLVVTGTTLTLTLSGALSALLLDRTNLLSEIKSKDADDVITIRSTFYTNIVNAITRTV